MNIQFGHRPQLSPQQKQVAQQYVNDARYTVANTVDTNKAIRQLADAVDVLIKNA